MKEKDRQNNLYRAIEGDVHKMEKDEWVLQNKIKEREDTRKRVESMRETIDTFNKRVKDADAQLAEAQGPIDALEADFKITEQALNAQITEAQSNVQASNQSNDRLESIHKDVERYVMQRRAQKLTENERRSEQADLEIKECMDSLQKCRESITQLDREIGGGDAKRANLQENIRIRQLARQVKDIQDKIDGLDLEAAARARRNFEEKYGPEKEKEQKLQASYSHIAGELSSLRAQLKQSEKDMKEFKEIDTKYTDQLVKVKMSDVANNDLELYAKALDNAIMKYHGLKMEEVNDTMRHLWNRTYQGTDIDGIKIRSDVEGGASKRSYNYRVVMTKDQVEMDMRGRCSAGQKMLASIIIRLALSDSFGQNCGILALDEPTNALDRENIDALADSLVDIINERKHQSNFQLIIITHDETFLAKLGQNNIMQHYWRVSRDARQKSIIERQNFSTS
ncbi:P-loop containing nucleoside triphosphate hydrolase protein [Armillaria fumosa]|nr:P-loop containing nucleoside triphosphate hydrolase protein [Armillaria fumosa]